jgi:hypothetical protein
MVPSSAARLNRAIGQFHGSPPSTQLSDAALAGSRPMARPTLACRSLCQLDPVNLNWPTRTGQLQLKVCWCGWTAYARGVQGRCRTGERRRGLSWRSPRKNLSGSSSVRTSSACQVMASLLAGPVGAGSLRKTHGRPRWAWLEGQRALCVTIAGVNSASHKEA